MTIKPMNWIKNNGVSLKEDSIKNLVWKKTIFQIHDDIEVKLNLK